MCMHACVESPLALCTGAPTRLGTPCFGSQACISAAHLHLPREVQGRPGSRRRLCQRLSHSPRSCKPCAQAFVLRRCPLFCVYTSTLRHASATMRTTVRSACVRVSMPTCRVTRDLREVKHVYQNVKVTFVLLCIPASALRVRARARARVFLRTCRRTSPAAPTVCIHAYDAVAVTLHGRANTPWNV